MDEPKLEVHYSILKLVGQLGFFLGSSLALWFIPAHLSSHNWYAPFGYAASAAAACAALLVSYRLLTARRQVIISVDATGFKDMRLAQAAVPWTAIRSISIDFHYRSNTTIGLALELDPAFVQGLSIDRNTKLANSFNFSRSVLFVDTTRLDVEADEIARFANVFIEGQHAVR